MSIVFFAPYSAIWKHFEVIDSFLKLHKKTSSNIVLLTCNKTFNYFCNSMSAWGLTEFSSSIEKDKVCRLCVGNSRFINKFLKLQTFDIGDYLSQNDLKQIQDYKNEIDPKNWKNIEFDGYKFWNYASYEYILQRKSVNLLPNREFMRYFKNQMSYCALTLRASNNYFDRYDVSESYVYNDNYGMNRIFQESALKRQIKIFSLQASGPIGKEYQRVRITSHFQEIESDSNSAEWNRVKNTPLKIHEIIRVFKIVLALLDAKSFWVYSSKTKYFMRKSVIRESLKVPKNRKIILFTMSSHDEWLATSVLNRAEISVPLDQFEIIKLLAEFCKFNTDFCVIVRAHPRMYPNKRESKTSDDAKRLESYFSDNSLPNNLILNTPDQKVSLTHAILSSDYILNVLSTAGLEAIILGKPVISFKNSFNTSYPAELNRYLRSSTLSLKDLNNSSYSQQENDLLVAFRWLYFRHYRRTLNVNLVYRFFYSNYLRLVKKIKSESDAYGMNNRIIKFIEYSLVKVNYFITILFQKVSIFKSFIDGIKINLKIESQAATILKIRMVIEKKLVVWLITVLKKVVILG